MKYFTNEWWKAGSPDFEAVFQSYQTYLASIKERIPNELWDLKNNYTLHDAEVKRISNNFHDRSAIFTCDGWNQNLLTPIRYQLHFTEVSKFELLFPQKDYVEQKLDDIAYWEIEAVNDELQICMLFVTEAELHIRFRGFCFTLEPRIVKQP